MTETEFFNKGVACGDFLVGHSDAPGKGCGARNWKPVREFLLAPWARKLICLSCGEYTLVEVPGWREKRP